MYRGLALLAGVNLSTRE